MFNDVVDVGVDGAGFAVATAVDCVGVGTRRAGRMGTSVTGRIAARCI